MLLSTIYGQVENNNAFAVTTISKGNMSIPNCSFFSLWMLSNLMLSNLYHCTTTKNVTTRI